MKPSLVFEGLFNKAISQSGAPLSFWAMHNKTVNLRQHAMSIMSLYGCNEQTIQMRVECLRKVPWSDLLNYDKTKVSTKSLAFSIFYTNFTQNGCRTH